MDRLAADDRGHRPRRSPDGHRLPDQLLGIPASDRLTIDETEIVNVGNQHPDLVAVTSQHQTWPLRVASRNNQIAMHIGTRLHIGTRWIGKGYNVVANQRLDRLLKSGRTGSLDRLTKKLEGKWSSAFYSWF